MIARSRRPAVARPAGGPLAYDFDGDGAQEIVIGPVNGSTAAVVVAGGPSGARPTALSSAAVGAEGVTPDLHFGSGLASADFDGDGHTDLAIGTPDVNLLAVVYGASEPLTGRRQLIEGEKMSLPSGRYGFSLLARDFNGDGFGDLVVGAPGSGKEAGSVQILFGAHDGLQTRGAATLDPPTGVTDNFGLMLGTGDLDDDGHIDLVEGGPDPGHLGFCRGSERGPTSCELVSGNTETWDVAVADVNGDGRDDIIQGDRESGGLTGELRLWLGGDRGPSPNPVRITPTILGIPPDVIRKSEFGAAVEAGPLDGDDYADVVVGMPGAVGQEGRIAFIPGGRDGYEAGDHKVVRAELTRDATRFGSTLALLRLAGGGETPDVVVAADGAEPNEAVHVVRDGRVLRIEGLERVIEGLTTDLKLGRMGGS